MIEIMDEYDPTRFGQARAHLEKSGRTHLFNAVPSSSRDPAHPI